MNVTLYLSELVAFCLLAGVSQILMLLAWETRGRDRLVFVLLSAACLGVLVYGVSVALTTRTTPAVRSSSDLDASHDAVALVVLDGDDRAGRVGVDDRAITKVDPSQGARAHRSAHDFGSFPHRHPSSPEHPGIST